jgi:glycosyltransferase involved in cell wall biosynthesis
MNILAYVHLRNIYRSTGAGRVAREMTEHLAALPGVNLQVLADPGDYRTIVPQVGAPWTGYQYHFMASETSRQQARWYLTNSPTAEHYWPEADLTYCTAESFVPVRRSRLAVTVHDAQLFEPGAHKMNAALLLQRLKWSLLFSRLSRSADVFHTVSEFSADRLGHYFPGIRSRLKVVYNAVSSRFFDPVTAEGLRIIAKLGLQDRPFILVPGGLHFRKNAELILEAWPLIREQCPEISLVIANHCAPQYLERARSLAPSLVLAGFLEEEELCAIYNAAQLVWFPSRYEGFGLPVVEAMACNTPVVTSNTTSLPEVAGSAAVLVSPDRPSEHVDAIAGLLADSAACERMRRAGCIRARDFTWERSAQQLAGYFAALV